MCCWYGSASGPLGGFWWLIPLVGIILCIALCRFFRSRSIGRRFCGWQRVRSADVEALKNEIRELREEIGKVKGQKGA